MKQLKDPDASPPDVRWRMAEGRRWQYGRFVGRSESGDVNLVADKTGASRTLLAHKVEFQVKGPRGGVDWVSAEQAVRPMSNE